MDDKKAATTIQRRRIIDGLGVNTCRRRGDVSIGQQLAWREWTRIDASTENVGGGYVIHEINTPRKKE